MTKRIYAVSMIAVTVLAWVAASIVQRTVAGESKGTASKPSEIQYARMSDDISIHAAGRGNPWINLSDGHELITPYSGPPELTRLLEQNEARPLSLCSADFDEDGVPDLISGYAGPNGGGIITLLRGNVDSIYPNAPEAKQRKAEGRSTDAPFQSPAFVFAVPEPADFIGAGDFDGDGHCDVVTAARGSNKLYLISGDSKGGLSQTKRIDLPGEVTAMVVGEINRRDGLDDIVVGVSGEQGSKVLVFEGPEGALRASPEAIALPAEATSLALGQLDDRYEMDLAIAAGNDLIIVHGRDRKLSLGAKRQEEVTPAAIEEQTFPFEIYSIATGDFKESSEQEIAMLCDDGKLRLLSRHGQSSAELSSDRKNRKLALTPRIDLPVFNNEETRNRTKDEERDQAKPKERGTKWNQEILTEGAWSPRDRLAKVRPSSIPLDSVLVLDGDRHQLDIVVSMVSEETLQAMRKQGAREYPKETMTVVVETEEDNIAALLPMRLNSDALSDLVTLKANGRAITILETVSQITFTVTNTNDSGPGSIRQAILDANSNPGADAINFRIPASGVSTIRPQSMLPEITDPVTLDGTTQPGFVGKPLIELNGASIGVESFGLAISAGTSVVRGLAINSFAGGVAWGVNGNNALEGNFIGTDAQGKFNLGNYLTGVYITGGADRTTIGGTTAAARNVISGNNNNARSGNNIYGGLLLDNAAEHLIQGNLIGTDITGTKDLGNSRGMRITTSSFNNLIGGTTAGARNLVSGNNGDGVLFDAGTAAGTLVQGNYIGTDITGTKALGNVAAGVGFGFGGAPNNTVGGTTSMARNIISGTNGHGIALYDVGSTGNQAQGNYIGTDVTGTLAVPNSGSGIFITRALGNTFGGVTDAARNIISGNLGHGVSIGTLAIDPATGRRLTGGSDLVVQGNYIGTDATGTRALGNGLNGVFVDLDSIANTIGGNRIAFNNRSGVNIPNVVTENPGVRITILSNSIFSNASLGIDLGPPGVTPNDVKDPDTGANELQNFPVLTSTNTLINSVTPAGSIIPAVATIVTGTFNSVPNRTFTLQFFLGSNCDGSGHQFTGAIPIALQPTIQVTTDSNGNAPFAFTFDFPNGASSGYVNSTATDATGNTSEFSSCIAVTNPNGPQITSACKGDGKQLIVNGLGFVDGAKVYINGEVEKKTRFVSSTQVIAFKAGKRTFTSDKLKVRNPDSSETPELTYTQVNCPP
jgi:hypothetical protein